MKKNCRTPMHTTYLLLGSNLGDRDNLLKQALEALYDLGNITRTSRIKETIPWGFSVPVPPFLNQALCLETELGPEKLLDKCLEIEKRLGRERPVSDPSTVHGRPYFSRLIDIDILLYDNLILKSERLTLPHPHLKDRDFAKVLLEEILPKTLSLKDFLPDYL